MYRDNILNTCTKERFDRCSEIKGYHLCTESADTCSRYSGSCIIARLPSCIPLADVRFKKYGRYRGHVEYHKYETRYIIRVDNICLETGSRVNCKAEVM
jgi:hypothetical protein